MRIVRLRRSQNRLSTRICSYRQCFQRHRKDRPMQVCYFNSFSHRSFLHGFQVAYRMDYLTVSTSAHSPSSCRKRMKSPFLWRMTCNHNLVIFCKLSSSRVQITLFLLLPWYSLVFLSSSFAAAESSIVSIPVLHIAAADASTGQLFSPSRQFHLQRRLSPFGSSLDSRLPQSSRVAPKLPRSSSPRE